MGPREGRSGGLLPSHSLCQPCVVARESEPSISLLTLEHRAAAGRKWRHYCKLSDYVCVCLCAVLQVIQCSASVISEYYCQLLPEFLDIVDWWLVLPSGFGYYLDYRFECFQMVSLTKFNMTNAGLWITGNNVTIW